jgi:hypothetical protein
MVARSLKSRHRGDRHLQIGELVGDQVARGRQRGSSRTRISTAGRRG